MGGNSTLLWLSTVPWLLLVAIAAPLLLAVWRSQTYPTRVLVGILLVPILCSLLVALWAPLLLVLAIVDGVILVIAAIDYITLPVASRGGRGTRTAESRKTSGVGEAEGEAGGSQSDEPSAPAGRLAAERKLPRTTSINAATPSELTLRNGTRRTFRGFVRDDLPEGIEAEPAVHPVLLPPLSKATYTARVTPTRRGVIDFQRVYLETFSALRLWKRQIVLPVASRLNVYPDMKQMAEYALLARTDRLSLIGVRRTRRIGQDSDFERLRDYTPDDNYRHIDWRSTARRHKLTVRQFQSDQSQRIMLLLDCGRMMTNERAGMSLLDHSLNAALMMAYVALSQGDSVGMLCFSDRVHAYLPPRGGRNQLNRLLQAGFDQFPRLVESRYDQAFLHLSNHCKRRTLVALMTSVIDEVNAGQVVDYLGNLVGRHLPLGLLIRDRQIFDAADHPSDDPTRLYRAAVAAEILCWRDQLIHDLRHRGSLVLDVFPEEMTAPLVNEYLRIKADHLL
ncbi:DUF58 domain-containing protein [Candidatus Laterigemmans baculatus]|nr:DUF58 domain-containing protein [Candidatus Laterigemmans baculatus]